MRKVAKQAGVHVTTISLALRNHPSLPLATRERLRALAKRMGYRSDPALCSLVAYRLRLRPPREKSTVAYVTNWETEWGWKEAPAQAQYHASAAARAPELGYQLEHCWLGARGLTAQRFTQSLHERGISGMIIASHGRKPEHALDIDWPLFSAVRIGFLPRTPAMHSVANDQRGNIQRAVRRALDAGYRRIGLALSEWWDRSVDYGWSAGFLAEQRALESGERVPILTIPETVREPVVPRAAFERWITLQRPEVIMGYGYYLLPRLAEMKISVPGDVAFIDLFLDSRPNQGIAGIRQNCHRVGELAVELLSGQLLHHTFGLPDFPASTRVEGTWFEGVSLPPRDGMSSARFPLERAPRPALRPRGR